MMKSVAVIDCSKITDSDSFHDEFDRVFGFPAFYGRNMDAWIDCMSYLDQPNERMTSIHCQKGQALLLQLDNVVEFKKHNRGLFDDIVECTSFVNWRLNESNHPPVLALSFYV